MDDKRSALTQKIKLWQASHPLISGKWKLPVLMAIGAGVTRFREMYKLLSPITTRSLSNELKELETDMLIVRIADDLAPLKSVNYILSPLGKELIAVIEHLMVWHNRNYPSMQAMAISEKE